MTGKTQITPFKLARYKERLTGPVRPIHWDVDPSTVCDHTCRGCPYIFTGEVDPMLGVRRPEVVKSKRGFLDYDAFCDFVLAAVDRGAEAITFVGGGEPTMHPDFARMCDRTDSAGIKFGVVTHLGHRYDNRMFEALAYATWARVSLNAGTPATYQRHQGRDHFEQALKNAELLATLGPRVGVSFLVTNDNWHEIYRAALLARSQGLAYIQFKPIIERDLGSAYRGRSPRTAGYTLIEAIETELADARHVAGEGFQVLDQWSNRLEELRRHERGEFSGKCHVPRFNPKLGANGVVYTCCELAYSDEGALGSIYEEPLEAILERAGQSCMEMMACPHCWDKPLNTIINDGRIDELVAPPESVDQEFV